jgi:hypothetical protein
MKLAYVRERYTYYTGKASEIVRQLAFAGIAVIWVFRTQSGDLVRVPQQLLPPAASLIVALVFDFLQYIAGSLAWGVYQKVKESQQTTEDAEFLAPRPINWPALFFFWAKVIAIAVAYALLFCFLVRQMWS